MTRTSPGDMLECMQVLQQASCSMSHMGTGWKAQVLQRFVCGCITSSLEAKPKDFDVSMATVGTTRQQALGLCEAQGRYSNPDRDNVREVAGGTKGTAPGGRSSEVRGYQGGRQEHQGRLPIPCARKYGRSRPYVWMGRRVKGEKGTVTPFV